MYLALEKPWRRGEPVAAVVAQPEVPTATEPAVKKGKKRRGRSNGGGRGDELLGSDGGGVPEETAPVIELTAADRKLSWRGPEVALPPAQIDMGSDGGSRSLSDDEIRETVREQSRPIIDCLVSAASGTDLRATVTIRMLVDGKGNVTKHRVQAPEYLFERGVPACVDKAVGRLRFPATGAFTLVTTPFELG